MKSPDDLLTFLAVARSGSISGASRHLSQDPATVGRKISRLERSLGETLFAKSPKGYSLTEAGAHLLVRAEELENVLADIDGSFLQASTQRQGKLRIGAPDGCATFLLPQVCAKLASTHPGLVLEIVASSRELDLLNREVDLSISVTRPTAKAILSTPLVNYHLHFAVARDRVTDDIEKLPLISYIPELLVDPGLDIPQSYKHREPSLRSNSVLVQWEWLKAGQGIGLVHDFAFRRDHDLVRVYPEFQLERSYYLNIRRDDAKFKRMKSLADTISREIQQDLTPGVGERE